MGGGKATGARQHGGKNDDKDLKGAGPILGNLALIVAALSGIGAGFGTLSGVLDLPFSLRLWAVGALASLCVLSLLWMIADAMKPAAIPRGRKRAAAVVLGIVAGVVLWLVLGFAMDFKSVQYHQAPSSSQTGLLTFRAPHLPATLTVSVTVRQDATLVLRVLKAPADRLQFLNPRSFGTDVLLSNFGNREEVVLSYQVQNPVGSTPDIHVEGHPEQETTVWLDAQMVATKKWWFGAAGVAICIVGSFLLLQRSS